MFDSKEIARKALLRADEIIAKRKRVRKMIVMCATAAVLTAGISLTVFFTVGSSQPDFVTFEDNPIPLAEFQQPGEESPELCRCEFCTVHSGGIK